MTRDEWDNLNEGDRNLKTDHFGKVEIDGVEMKYSWGELIPTTQRCDECGGKKEWCITCNCYTKVCCHEYGTCMCS